ncbi:CBS domain-containing protein [Altererythrobacter aerius]|uniref:CBS domain-containing protein n=1 Tax=Tsuneonella aeria TaxID=1837929 RepID=A0A6I4TFC0_9SPHN|nr:CBS domain-containing protein [Tsuneonella aeria]MXO75414.1 CBS domain-containing protein [Tsuneonella aeria]
MDIARVMAGKSGSEIVTCDIAMTMRAALDMLATRRIGAMPVMDGGRVAGIFSERDVIYCLQVEGEASLAKPVGEVMTAPPITVTPSMRIDEALELMTRRRIRHLPVMQDEALCGFVSIGDLVKAQIDGLAQEAEVMRAYIQTA